MNGDRHYGPLVLRTDTARPYELYEREWLLAVASDAGTADKLFFKRAVELATANSPAGQASFTPAGRAVFFPPEKGENARRLAKSAEPAELTLRNGGISWELYEGGELLAVASDKSMAERLFFTRALAIATEQSPAGRASFTPAGRAIFFGEG